MTMGVDARVEPFDANVRFRRPSWQRIASWAWPAALVAALFVTLVGIGYMPMDEGNIQAQAWRILHGQVPHRDVIFARPMGSPLFHMIDFALPLPLFVASRLLGIIESAGYSLLLARLIFDRRLERWGVVASVAAAGSLLVNMHTFLLTAWYTTDGLLFAALGFVLLSRGVRERRDGVAFAGMASLGVAVLMKQSFTIAPLIGLTWFLWGRRGLPIHERLQRAALAAVSGALPMILYCGALAALGGLRPFLQQVLGAKAVWGATFVTAFARSGLRGELLVFLGALAGLLAVGRVSDSAVRAFQTRGRRRWKAVASSAGAAARIGITVLVIRFVLHNRFAVVGSWGIGLVWAAAFVVLWRAAMDRTFDGIGALIVLTGWMASLSWGYPVPNLVAGAAALYVLDRCWQGFRLTSVVPGRRARLIAASGVVLASLVGGGVLGKGFLDAREAHPYFDLAKGRLTSGLIEASTEFGDIRAAPRTVSYLTSLTACLRRYPQPRQAVLPENPGIYPALGLRNPFPIDWMNPAETKGQEPRIEHAARELDASGGYTVLFQTFGVTRLTRPLEITYARAGAKPYGSPLVQRLWHILQGQRFRCGYFVGVTAPERSTARAAARSNS